MSNIWQDEELEASVAAYRLMQQMEQSGSKYTKKSVYQQLAARFNRSDKAFEYRMQNISAVLNDQNQPWLQGLKPAGHVGQVVYGKLAHYLQQSAHQHPAQPPANDYQLKLPALRDWLIAVARQRGKVTYGQVMHIFHLERLPLRLALNTLAQQASDGGEPIITALIIYKGLQRSAKQLLAPFGITDEAEEREHLYHYWQQSDRPASNNPPLTAQPKTGAAGNDNADDNQGNIDVRAARFASIEARPEQAQFRRRVYLAYQGCCLISGCSVPQALDAAHKQGRDWRQGHNRAEDGYLMRKDLHALYDSGLLQIIDGRVHLKPSVRSHYAAIEGVTIKRPIQAQG